MALRSLLSKLTTKKATNTLDVSCQRFIQVFHQHNVETTQIPRLLPQVSLKDLQSPSTLLGVLTPALLDDVAKLFNVRVPWLEGIDEQIYENLAWYKSPLAFLEHAKQLGRGTAYDHQYPVRVLCTSKHLDYKNGVAQDLAFVLLERIAELGDEDIYRYHVYNDGGHWGHQPFRIEAKVIARIVFHKMGIPVPLFEITQREMDELLEGRLIPTRLLRRCVITSPSLEDFALSATESGVAKETDELEEVLRYIDEHGLSDFSFELKSEDEATDQASELTEANSKSKPSPNDKAVKAANKKHAHTNEIKRRFLEFHAGHGKEYPSIAAAAETFFKKALTENEQYAFKNFDCALRAFREALKTARANATE